MDITYITYPEFDSKEDFPLFYIEFHQWNNRPEEWRLFKRQFIHTREQIKKMLEINPSAFKIGETWIWLGREGHPWAMAEGTVAPEGTICMETKLFLKYLVDALNEKAAREAQVHELQTT